MDNTITILFLNFDGGGFATPHRMPVGTTLDEFIEMHSDNDPSEHKIRVNRSVAAKDHVLQDGDKVTMTPLNVKGA